MPHPESEITPSSLNGRCRRLLRVFSTALARVHHKALLRPRRVIISVLLLTMLFGSQLPRLRILFSVEDMVGAGIPSADELRDLKQRYEDGTLSMLLLSPGDGQFSFTDEELCAIRSWYSVERAGNPELLSAFSTFDISRAVETRPQTVKYNSVLPLDCDPPRLLGDAQEAKRLLDSSPWPALHERASRLSLLFGFNFRHIEDPRLGSFNPKALDPLRQSVDTDLRRIVPNAAVHWVGTADYQWYVQKGFELSVWINGAMILFLLIASRLFYGTWLSGMIYCGTLLIAGVWIFGAKALVGSEFDLLSTGLFLILGVSCLEDFAFLSAEQMKGHTWRTSMRSLLVPSCLTSVLTMIGFASLMSSELPIVSSFGMWCAIGAALEWAMLFVCLPAALRVFGKGANWVDPRRAILHGFSERLSLKGAPRWVALAALIVYPAAVIAFPKINPNGTLGGLFPKEHPYNQATQTLLASKGWQGTASLSMDSPAELAALDGVVSSLRDDPVVGANIIAVESPARIVEWMGKGRSLPQELIESDYRSSRLERQLVDEEGRPRVQLYLKDTSVLELQRLKERTDAICHGVGCRLGGELLAYSDFATKVPGTLLDSIRTGGLLVSAVIAFLAIAFGRVRALPAMLLGSFWGPCLMVVLMAELQIPMDFQKCIFASVLLGLAGDNAIHYLFAARSRRLRVGVDEHGPASVQTAALMAFTCLFYLGSYFDPPKTFGLIMFTGLTAGLIGDLWFLKRLLPEERV